MLLPFVQPTASPLASMLQEMAQRRQERDKDAAAQLLAQQRLQLDRERMGAEDRRAGAQEERAKIAAKREERFYNNAERKNALESVGDMMPYLSPDSPKFNPQMAQQFGAAHGLNVTQAPLPAMPGPVGPAPMPGFEGPIEDPAHARARAMGPSLGQAFVDQTEDGHAGMMFPGGSEAGVHDVGLHEGQFVPIEGPEYRGPGAPPMDPEAVKRGDQAAQEAMLQQQERDKFTQDLHGFDQRQKEHGDQLAAYQHAKQFPTMQVDTGLPGSAPLTFDTGQMAQQSQSFRAQRADRVTESYSSMAPEAQARARQMALQGFDDQAIAKAMEAAIPKAAALDEKAREFDQGDLTKRYGIDKRAARHGSGGGGMGIKQQLVEANQVGGEMERALKDVTDPRLGIRAQQHHLKTGLNMIDTHGDNPTVWTNYIDAMIRANTGKAAIMQQYNLYKQKSGGAAANFDSWLEAFKTGMPGEEVRRNLRDAGQASLSEAAALGGEMNKNFHDTYDNDPRVKGNPKLAAKYAALERGTFGTMEGYGGRAAAAQKPDNALVKAAKKAKLSASDRQAVDWAEANPGDPRAAAIMQRNGM